MLKRSYSKDFGGGGSLLSLTVRLLDNLLKLIFQILAKVLNFILNFIKTPENRYKVRKIRNFLMVRTYKFYNLKDYQKKFNLKEENYSVESIKVHVAEDMLISFFEYVSYIHDSHNNILCESFPNNDLSKLIVSDIETIRVKKSKIIHVEEAVNMALKFSNNYWHFVFSFMDKIYCLEKNNFKGKYLVKDIWFLKHLLRLMRVSDEKIIFIKPNQVYQIDKLHIIEDYCKYDENTVLKVRNKILENIDMTDIDKYPKKLYVRRIGNYGRCVKNEAEVLDLLKQYKFETMFPDDNSVEEQIKYFYAAEIVVAPHGACSTNALFMRPNSHFVECFSYTWLNPCMLKIIKGNDMYYHMVSENQSANHAETADFMINTTLLDDVIYKYVS